MWSFYIVALSLLNVPLAQSQYLKDLICPSPIDASFPPWVIAHPADKKSFQENENVTVECVSHLRNGERKQMKHTCQNGSWVPHLNWTGECPEVKCAPLNSWNQKGVFHPSDDHFIYKSRIDFYCNLGYTLFGSAVVHCLEGGLWDDAFPVCLVNPEEKSVTTKTSSYTLTLAITGNILVLILFSTLVYTLFKRHKRQKQREEWHRYSSTYPASRRLHCDQARASHQHCLGPFRQQQYEPQVTDL